MLDKATELMKTVWLLRRFTGGFFKIQGIIQIILLWINLKEKKADQLLWKILIPLSIKNIFFFVRYTQLLLLSYHELKQFNDEKNSNRDISP